MARTVANVLITQTLIDAQNGTKRVPYIRIYRGADYSSRLEYLEHHEEAYRERAIIGLSNRDNVLDAVDMDGYQFWVGYGHTTGAGDEYVNTAPLWVKSHQIISIEGERIYQMYAEGMWMRLREQKVIAGITGSAPLYDNVFAGTKTVYELMELIIEGAMGWTLDALGTADDGIINTFKPIFDVNQLPYENAASLLYRLLWMTNTYLRPRPTNAFTVIYPQTADAVDKAYYSNKAHWFKEYAEKTILLIPNSIVVLCNQDPVTGEWDTTAYPLITGTASDATQIAKYTEIIQPFIAGNIRNQVDADGRAAAILTRMKAEILGGKLIVPHDAQIELYDKVQVADVRT